MIYIAWIIIGFAALRFIIAFVNFISPLFLKEAKEQHNDKLSVLVPARNEAYNLPTLIEKVCSQTYPNYEVIVYNDESVDETEDILYYATHKYIDFKYINSEGLPEGWAGKNHACYQLAKHATGDYLLFLDADVEVAGNLFRNAIQKMKNDNLKLLSIFPQQKMISLGEKLTVPLMNWILLSLLPLIFVQKSKRKSLAAANGQFMLFEAENYRRNQYHEKLKNSLVEDIQIIRLMKQQKHKVATLLGNNDVVCRMYNNYNEGVQGFAKNVIHFFGNSVGLALLFLLIVNGGILAIILILSIKHILFYFVLIAGIRFFISLKSKQKTGCNFLLHPFQMLVLIQIVIEGIRVKKTKVYKWKGRKISN